MPSDVAITRPINRVFLRDMKIAAHIGYYSHEKGRTQPLVVSVEIAVEAADFHGDKLNETVDYDIIAGHVRALAAHHVDLVETFAEKLATLCLAHPLVNAVRVHIDKPEAVPGAVAGVEIIRTRD